MSTVPRKREEFASRTGSTRGTYKLNGVVMGRTHPVNSGSSKLNEAYASRGSFSSTSKDSYKDPGRKQPLTKYHPNALRNRMPVHFANEAAPQRRFCQPRNQHTHDFFNVNKEAGYQRFRTTSQNFYDYDVNVLDVGATNPGIVSSKAKEIHKMQLK